MTVPRFWRKLDNRYNLRGTRCEECGEAFYPVRKICPNCRRSGEMVEYGFPKHGRVVSYTVIEAAPPHMDGDAPYAVAIIETPEGTTFTSQLVDVELGDVEIGMPVEGIFKRITEDGEAGAIHYGLKFRPDWGTR